MEIRGVFPIFIVMTLLVVTVSADTTKMTLPFTYSFSSNGTLNEAGSLKESTSPYFWLNSGGKLIIQNGIGKTVRGALPKDDFWRILYFQTNAEDTDNGYHPQNIFRLVTKEKLNNSGTQAYFNIVRDEPSLSPNRGASNGILLMNKYQDQNNLYYMGIRVDGTAVIKKKINGIYTTLAQNKIFGGAYDKLLNDNLLPKGEWIGLKTEITTLDDDNSVYITLYMDRNRTGNWTLIAEANEDKDILPFGYSGIRTDFMDVQFDNFSLSNF